MNCLGILRPNRYFSIAPTDYVEFQTKDGVDGLVYVRHQRLDILFIGTSHPGTGQFRSFIHRAKAEFKIICIWEVWSILLQMVLPRYGFKPAQDWQDGHLITGFKWERL